MNLGTILYGSKSTVPEDKRLRLEIYIKLKPTKLCGGIWIYRLSRWLTIVIRIKRLEYRGYDSAGVMIYDGESIKLSKTKG
jgi:hypothetical protein